MSRILLADDSPHAQRMGERILSEEGLEVVSITEGETALIRLADVDPDVVVADAFLPGKSGFDICSYIKSHSRHRHTRVILTAGALEPLDEQEARRAGADGVLRKPFEASAVMEALKPLIEAAEYDRNSLPPEPETEQAANPGRPKPEELIRAAVTLALARGLSRHG